MKVALCAARRRDGGRRDELAAFVQSWWPSRGIDWPLYVAEDTAADGPFNRGRLLNRAAEMAGDCDAYVFIDLDAVCEPDQLRSAVEHAISTGHLTLPYERYVSLNRSMSDRVLRGFSGSWEAGSFPMPAHIAEGHVSSIVVVPAALWHTVGGFDEAFEGWGCEDSAFHRACEIHGPVARVAGSVFHLWHPVSVEVDMGSPMFLRSAQRSAWYGAAQTVADLELLRSPVRSRGVLVVVVTHGRQECIERAIPSFDKHVHGPIARLVISDDSGDAEYQAWLHDRFGREWEIVAADTNTGFTQHCRRIWALAGASGLPWMFTLEEDFTFERDVDLADMQAVMDAERHLVQIALRRQAWFGPEVEAGGIIEQDPGAYTDRDNGEHQWIEHRKFWTSNPNLMRTSLCSGREWPDTELSEWVFGNRLFADRPEAVSAFWGRRTDAPWVIHDGQRIGTGY